MVGQLLGRLGDAKACDELHRLSDLTESELARLKRIPIELSHDPDQQSLRLKERATRIERLVGIIERAEAELDETSALGLRDALTKQQSDAEAADVAAKSLFADAPLTGVGSEVWLKLWAAARSYSEQVAYSEESFPVTRENARCVLCQQPLNEEGRWRLGRFDEFVRDRLRATADASLRKLKELADRFDLITLRHSVTRQALAELASESPELSRSLRLSIIRLRLRRRVFARSIEKLRWHDPPEQALSVLPECRAEIDAIRGRAETLKESTDPTGKPKLQRELTELEDRVWLGTVAKDIAQATRIAGLCNLVTTAIDTTSTIKITNQAKRLADKHVTRKLRDRFVDEVNRLDAERLRVELVRVEARKGSSQYRIRLVGAPSEQIGQVLSEGEHRCVALAGFLAELATENKSGPLVFDDPVSSLDHRWRSAVAKRLVYEGKSRQVIVFTHDLIFVESLLNAAKHERLKCEHRSLVRTSKGFGTVSLDLPWRCRKLKGRFYTLELETREAQKLHDAGEEEAYRSAVRDVYGRLAETIEQAIEQRLFNGVVVRWDDHVKVGKIHGTDCIEGADLRFLAGLHKTCCDWKTGHNESAGNNGSPPSPQSVLEDIKTMRDWVDEFNKRQKLASSQ